MLDKEEDMTEDDLERSFFTRTFSPMGDGSLRAAILALLASAMGTGMFSFPYLCNEAGLGMVTIYILIGAAFSAGSMYMLTEICIEKQITSYSEMAEKLVSLNFRRFAEFCVVIYPWGITICFQVVFSKLFLELLKEAFHVKFSTAGNEELVRKLVVGVSILVNLIFIFKKDLSALRYTTLLGTCSVFYCIVAVLLTAFVGGNARNQAGEVAIPSLFSSAEQRWNNMKWFNFDNLPNAANHIILQFAVIATVIFCYVNHQMLFPLMSHLKRPSFPRLFKIIRRVHVGEIIFYLLISYSGYLFLVGYD